MSSGVKVVVLFGQSNAEGYGQIKELEDLEGFVTATPSPTRQQVYDWVFQHKGIDDFRIEEEMQSATDKVFRHIQDGNIKSGMMGEVANTYCLTYYNSPTGPFTRVWDEPTRKGKMVPGFGAGNHNPPRYFGPELFISRMLRKYKAFPEDVPILFIKIAAGGSTLYDHWRSPTAHARLQEMNMPPAQNPSFYTGAIELLRGATKNIGTLFSELDGRTTEFHSFVWFQGFNDAVNMDARPAMLMTYENNLVDLVGDLRSDLGDVYVSIIASQICVNYDLGVDDKSADRSTLRTAQIRAQKRIAKSTSSDSYGVNRWYHYGGLGQVHLGIDAGHNLADLILSSDQSSALSLYRPPFYPIASCGITSFVPASGWFHVRKLSQGALEVIRTESNRPQDTCRTLCAAEEECKIAVVTTAGVCTLYKDGPITFYQEGAGDTFFKVYEKPLGYSYKLRDDPDAGAAQEKGKVNTAIALYSIAGLSGVILLGAAFHAFKNPSARPALALYAWVAIAPIVFVAAFATGFLGINRWSQKQKYINYGIYAGAVTVILLGAAIAVRVYYKRAAQAYYDQYYSYYYQTSAPKVSMSDTLPPAFGKFRFLIAWVGLIATPLLVYAIHNARLEADDDGSDKGKGTAVVFGNKHFEAKFDYNGTQPALAPNVPVRKNQPGGAQFVVPSGAVLLQNEPSHGTLTIEGTRATYVKKDDFAGQEKLFFSTGAGDPSKGEGIARVIISHLDESCTHGMGAGPTTGLLVDYQSQILSTDLVVSNTVTTNFASDKPAFSEMLGWFEFRVDTIEIGTPFRLPSGTAAGATDVTLSFYYCPPPLSTKTGVFLEFGAGGTGASASASGITYEYDGAAVLLKQGATQIASLPLQRKVGGDKIVTVFTSTGTTMTNNRGLSSSGAAVSPATVGNMVIGGPGGGGTWDIRAYSRALDAAETDTLWGRSKETRENYVAYHYPPMVTFMQNGSTRPQANIEFYPYMQSVARSTYYFKMGVYEWGNVARFNNIPKEVSTGESNKFASPTWGWNPTGDNWWLHENHHSYQNFPFEGQTNPPLIKFSVEAFAEGAPTFLNYGTMGSLNFYYFGKCNYGIHSPMDNYSTTLINGKTLECTFAGYNGRQYGAGPTLAYMSLYVLRDFQAWGFWFNFMGKAPGENTLGHFHAWEALANASGRRFVDVFEELAARLATMDFSFGGTEAMTKRTILAWSDGFRRNRDAGERNGIVEPGCSDPDSISSCCNSIRSLYSGFMDERVGPTGGWASSPETDRFSLYAWAFMYLPFKSNSSTDATYAFEVTGDVSLIVVRLSNPVPSVTDADPEIQHLPIFLKGQRSYHRGDGRAVTVKVSTTDLCVLVFINHNEEIPMGALGIKIPFKYRIYET